MGRHNGECILIEVGYTTLDGTDTITDTVADAPAANEAVSNRREELRQRTDIYTFFLQTSYDGIKRYGFIDPLEA